MFLWQKMEKKKIRLLAFFQTFEPGVFIGILLSFLSKAWLVWWTCFHISEGCSQSKSPTSPCSGPVCKEEGRPNWLTEQTRLPGCPGRNSAHTHRRDSPTSSACSAVAPILRFCLRLPRVCFLTFVLSAAQFRTVREGLRPAPPLLPPVPAISERPAIGGNRCQLLGKGVILQILWLQLEKLSGSTSEFQINHRDYRDF